MKNVLFALALAFTAQANARSLIAHQAAGLTHLNFAEGSPLAQRNINGGQIQLDYTTSEVTLTLYPSFHCPEGAFCAMMMPAPVIVTLPLVDRQVDTCGNVHYTAKKDLRTVDGINEEIVVSDNRGNRCLTFVALPPTGVSYRQQGFDRMEGKEFNYLHTFIAEKLMAQ